MGRKIKQNKITSPEKTKRINKNNLRLIEDFLAYLKSIKRSDGTISGYRSDLLIIMTFILDNYDNKDFTKLTKRDIIGLQNIMIENGNSSARIRRLKAAMSSLSNFVENVVADDDPELKDYRPIVRKIENPPLESVQEKTVFSEEEVEGLLKKLTDMGEYEKACFVALAAYGGRRKAELLRFKVSDFGEDHIVCDGALYESSPLLTKGGKMLNCYTLRKKFQPYLNAWVEERERLGIDSEWLFPDRSDMSQARQISTINSWSNTFSRMVGKPFYPHALRHYSATSYVKAGLPDSVIVDIFGWSTADMLSLYDDTEKNEKFAMYFRDGEIDTSGRKGFKDI